MLRTIAHGPACGEVAHLRLQALDLEFDEAPAREGEKHLAGRSFCRTERDGEELERRVWIGLIEAAPLHPKDPLEVQPGLPPQLPAGRQGLPVDARYDESEAVRRRQQGGIAHDQLCVLEVRRHHSQIVLVDDRKAKHLVGLRLGRHGCTDLLEKRPEHKDDRVSGKSGRSFDCFGAPRLRLTDERHRSENERLELRERGEQERMNRLLRIALVPFWTAQILTGAHSFVGNPVLGSPWLNRRGLHTFRVRLAHGLARHRRRRLASAIPEADRERFASDGFILKPNFLSADDFKALLAETERFAGPEREIVQGDAVTRRIALDPDSLKRLPATKNLIEMPLWRALIDYVGSFSIEPMTYIQTIFSKATQLGPDPQTTLHQDTFHPTVKAWLFLTDVPIEAGPFVYVRGSHRLTPERLEWEYQMSLEASTNRDIFTAMGSFRTGEAALAAMHLPSAEALAVSANTLIVADTFGFHARGVSQAPSRRVEIWAYGRPNPFWPFTGPDLWRLPILRHRKAQIFWWLMDHLERLGLGRNHWRHGRSTRLEGNDSRIR